MAGFSPRQIMALCRFVFWLTGQYEIRDLIPCPVSSSWSGSLHAMGAIILITAGYLQVTSDFIGNFVYGIISPAVGVPDTHTQICVVP